MEGMNEMPTKLVKRAARKLAKRDEKKRLIAESALEALKELGYANTSLRDIAERTDLSLGMLHYYFEDRTDLIIYCVALYKEEFVRKVRLSLENADGRDAVIDEFSEALVASIVDDEMIHRLWYDIRTQAMFDGAFRPVVNEIERKLIDIVRLAFNKSGHETPNDIDISYALIDGAFRHLMQGQMDDRKKSRDALIEIFRELLGKFL